MVRAAHDGDGRLVGGVELAELIQDLLGDEDRLEAGFGYRPDRSMILKAIYQREWIRPDAAHPGDTYGIFAGQLSVSF